MPPTIRRFGHQMLQQQLWCWGRDIEFPDGNLLMKYGFDRHRDGDDADRSTCYRFDQEQFHVCLWGFGMFFGNRELGGLFLDRFDFRPAWAPVESISLSVHWPDELPVFSRPRGKPQWERARELRQRSMRWIADYETWVRKTVGLRYRRECVDSWLRPFVRAEKHAMAWRYLGRQNWDQDAKSLKQKLRQFTLAKPIP